MKQCPTCGTSYNDPNLSFCLDDGTQLIEILDEQATFVRQSSDPMRVRIPQPTAPAQYIQIAQPVQKSGNGLKIILAVAAVGIVLVGAIGVVGALLYFNYSGKTTVANTGSQSPVKGASPVPSSSIVTSNTPSPSVSPPNSSETPIASVPLADVDRSAVQAELSGIEREIINAALKGNVPTLSDNTTDDFKSINVDGKVYDKKTMLAEARNATESKSWTFSMGKVELVSADENTAVIRYVLTVSPPASEPDIVRLTGTYVKQNGRWLLKTQKASTVR